MIIQRYVGRSVAAAILLVLVALLGLDLIFRIMGEVDNLERNYTFFRSVQYVMLKSPSRVYQMMPLAGMIGCLTGLGALANSSELVVMRAAGYSTFRMVWMAVKPALLFMLVALAVGEYIAPKTEQMGNGLRDVLRSGKQEIDTTSGLWLRDETSFVYVNAVQGHEIMLGLNIFAFDQQQNLESIITAHRGTFTQNKWLLEEVEQTRFTNHDGMPEQISKNISPTMSWQSSLNPELLALAVLGPYDLDMRSLWKYIAYLKKQNLNSIEYELAFWEKAFYPLVMVSLVLVGIAFVFGPLREVTMGYRIFWGVMMGIIFKTLQDTLGPVSIVFGFSPILAMFVPVLLSAGLGAILLARVR